MRFIQFLLLVTLTCIACDSIVASSNGFDQIKTSNSQRELTDGTHRKLREGVVEADVADVEERGFTFKVPNFVTAKLGGMATKSDDMAKKISASEKFELFVKQHKGFLAKLFRIKTSKDYSW